MKSSSELKLKLVVFLIDANEFFVHKSEHEYEYMSKLNTKLRRHQVVKIVHRTL